MPEDVTTSELFFEKRYDANGYPYAVNVTPETMALRRRLALYVGPQPGAPEFGVDVDKPMTKHERRQESWRRSSRKYRAVKARERAQETLFDEEARE